MSDHEIAMIASWADNGGPRGNPADMPPPRQFASQNEWSIGTPDLIVSSPVRKVDAVAADFQGDVDPSPIGLPEERYVKAVRLGEVTGSLETQLRRLAAGDPFDFEGEDNPEHSATTGAARSRLLASASMISPTMASCGRSWLSTVMSALA